MSHLHTSCCGFTTSSLISKGVITVPKAISLTHPHTHTPPPTHTAQNAVRVRNPNTTDVGSQYEGIVEIYHNGAWGTVCNRHWTFNDALVACRTAGFSSAVRAVTDGSYYGPGVGHVLLDDVHCTGDEINLFSCTLSSWGVVSSTCDHTRDAGVVCSDSECAHVLIHDYVMPGVADCVG